MSDIDLPLKKMILHHADEMSIDELSVCFQYLTKLFTSMQTDVMSTILDRILKIVENGTAQWGLFPFIHPIKMSTNLQVS